MSNDDKRDDEAGEGSEREDATSTPAATPESEASEAPSDERDREADDRDDDPDDSEDSSDEDVASDAGGGEAETAPATTAADGASAPADAPSAAGGDKGKRMSAGARLAAAKAAKAVAKAAKKEERKAAQAEALGTAPRTTDEPAAEEAPEDPIAQLGESELGRAALGAGRWWESNQQMGWIAIGAAVLAIAGFFGWQYQRESTDTAAGQLLSEAVEIASARIVPEAESAESAESGEDEEERTFPTRSARTEAALEAYQAVVAQYPDHPAAAIARLGAGRALLALGRHEEAQQMYQEAFDRGGRRSSLVAWQALEGVAFAQEAAGHTDEARETFERLEDLDDHAYEHAARYHLARLTLASGERDEARTALRELVEALRGDTIEGSSEPRFPYVLAQAEVRLRELDPSTATSAGPSLLGPGGGAPGGGQLDSERLQELIRQLQAGEGGGDEGGGE